MSTYRSRTTTGGLLAGLALAAVLAGCGGSTHKPSVPTARPTASESNADVGNAAVQGGAALTKAPPGASTAPRSQTAPGAGAAATRQTRRTAQHAGGSSIGRTVAVHKARQAPGTSNDDKSSTGGKTLNPCSLVSVSEVQSITGGFIGRVEAPLGPTCIYHVTGTPSNVTLAIEAASTAPAAHKGARQTVSVAGHAGYCVKLGSAMLLVPLSGGRVLNVTAPCALAQRFAAAALGHLTA